MNGHEQACRRYIGRQLIKARQSCSADWSKEYDLKEVMALLHVKSPKDHHRLLQFFYASTAEFKSRLLARVVPDELEENVIELLSKRKEYLKQCGMLLEDEHPEEIAALLESSRTIFEEVRMQLKDHKLSITNSDIVETLEALGWNS